MSEVSLVAQQKNVRRASDGTVVQLRGLRDGSAIGVPWEMALALEGKVFTINVGVGTSAIAGDAGFAVTTPDVQIEVPEGIAFIPLNVSVSVDALIDDVDFDIIGMVSSMVDTSPTGGTTTYSPVNHLINSGIRSSCIVESDITALTSPITEQYIEFFRARAEIGGKPEAGSSEEGIGPLTYNWKAGVDGPPPIVDGSGSVIIWCTGSSAISYFATITWAELPIDAVE